MRYVHGMTTHARRDDVLAKLRENREKHARVVAEARAGYIDKARDALAERLDKLASGKLVSLHFSLEPPVDHTDAYDTMIQMLTLEQREVIELSAEQVRAFYMDAWEWKGHFLAVNAAYSATAAADYGAPPVEF